VERAVIAGGPNSPVFPPPTRVPATRHIPKKNTDAVSMSDRQVRFAVAIEIARCDRVKQSRSQLRSARAAL